MKKTFKDYNSVQEIATSLINKPVSDFYVTNKNAKTSRNKGYFGNLIQEMVFGIKANNSKEADFKEDGLNLELKVIPFKKIGNEKNIKWAPKERLVLSMINYRDLAKDSFENSHLYQKHQHVQFIIYFDNPFGTIMDAYQIHWKELPIPIQEIIRTDYYKIQEKVKNGEAHLLSESDTSILAASRKGSGNLKDNRKQPFSEIPAKSRAFSIKTRYLKTLYYHMVENKGKTSTTENHDARNSDAYLKNVLNFLTNKAGISVYSYSENILKHKKPKKIKNVGNQVVRHLLKNFDSEIFKNLNLYGYKVRTITINSKGKIQESVPMPHPINPEEMIDWETRFEDSDVYQQLMDCKFIFVPIRKNNDDFILQRPFVFYFNENDYKNIKNLENVWENTRNLYKNPQLDEFKLNKNGEKYYLVDFIKQSDKKSFHVRPKARNSNHLYTIGNAIKIVPQTFWINKGIIQEAYEKATNRND